MGQALKKVSSLSFEDVIHTDVQTILDHQTEDVSDDIYEIQSSNEGDSIQGHILASEFKQIIQNNTDSIEEFNFSVRAYNSTDEWVPLFQHPAFQRRKPQLVSLEELNKDNDLDYYLIVKGVKKGPYDKFQISTMVDNKEILLTAMASINGGHTWTKLYTLEGFDRRTLKESATLPHIPSNIIERGNEEILTDTPETEALAGLAYLSNVKQGKAVDPQANSSSSSRSSLSTNEKASGFNASSFYKILLVASLIGIVYFGYVISTQLSSPFEDSGPIVGEHNETLTPVQTLTPTHLSPPARNPSARASVGEQQAPTQINNLPRGTDKFTTRSMKPILPARKSFMETKTFQESAQENNDVVVGDDPNYFYDNSSAMELDPVRSQVSKENYDDSMMRDENPLPMHDDLFDTEVAY